MTDERRDEQTAYGLQPAWMDIAFKEQGVKRYGTGECNPRIVEYNSYTNLLGYDDKISWCSSFINWCLFHAGVIGTGSALARSWLDWGVPLESPAYGCVVILTREDPASWKGHVGFFLRSDDRYVYLYGGNQLGEVRELAYARSRILGYRWPAAPVVETSA
jgi:uncharacterized protein (TIGR02594 family)